MSIHPSVKAICVSILTIAMISVINSKESSAKGVSRQIQLKADKHCDTLGEQKQIKMKHATTVEVATKK